MKFLPVLVSLVVVVSASGSNSGCLVPSDGSGNGAPGAGGSSSGSAGGDSWGQNSAAGRSVEPQRGGRRIPRNGRKQQNDGASGQGGQGQNGGAAAAWDMGSGQGGIQRPSPAASGGRRTGRRISGTESGRGPRTQQPGQPNAASPSTGRNMAYRLASLGDEIAGPVQKSFSCEGKEYGYYADTANQCKVFHVCVPEQKQHYSFFCNEGTIFDEEDQTCVKKSSGRCGKKRQ